MQKKKNRFLLFVCSFVPGAGEMYLGFMKMGVSLMLGFAILVLVPAVTYIDALAVFPVVMYIYCFFHANNLGTLSDEEFYATKDQYLFGMEGVDGIEKIRVSISAKYKKISAIVLIVIGLIMLCHMVYDMLVHFWGWNNFYVTQIRFFMNRIPRAVIAVAVIWIGCRLIRGKKVEDIVSEQYASSEQESINEQIVSDVQGSVDEQISLDSQDNTNEQ